MSVSLSQCLETGLKWGATKGALALVFRRGMPQVVGKFLGSFVGLTAGNYIVNNTQFCKKWDEKTQVITVIALAFFATCGVYAGYSYLNNFPMDISRLVKNEILWSIIFCINDFGITRPEILSAGHFLNPS